MTPEEAQTVLAAAKDSASNYLWADVVHLLQPVYDSHVLTGTDQGDAAYLLGMALLNQHAWDTASGYLTLATTIASADNQRHVERALKEIEHHQHSEVAAADGLQESEAAEALRAGQEALDRTDADDAQEHYSTVYNSPGLSYHTRAAAALGLAHVFVYRGDLTQARQYAEYVIEAFGSEETTRAAKGLLGWLDEQQAGLRAAEDGTTVNEYRRVWETASRAAAFGDYQHARTLYLSILDSPQIGVPERASTSYELAGAEVRLGMVADARAHLDYAMNHGAPWVQKLAGKLIDAIDRHAKAEELVALLDESTAEVTP